MNKNLLILGAGQYGQVAKEIAQDMGCFEKIDFLDDEKEFAIGKLSEYEKYSSSYSYAIVAMGNPKLRIDWIIKLEEACYKIAILVHPKAYVSPSAQIMKGSIIEPKAVVNTGCIISIGCIISAGAVVNHNSMCSDGVHVDCNATVSSNTLVPAGTKVCSGMVFKKDTISIDDLFFEFDATTNSETKESVTQGSTYREYCFEDGM